VAKGNVVAGGSAILLIAIFGYFIPVTDTGLTIPQVNDVCATGLGQMGQMFSGDLQKICREFGYLMYGIYGFGIIGIILIIVGGVVSGKKESEYIREVEETKGEHEPLDILKQRYAKGEISKEEFEKMKKDLV